jgi:hypothetical protein
METIFADSNTQSLSLAAQKVFKLDAHERVSRERVSKTACVNNEKKAKKKPHLRLWCSEAI